MASAAAAGASRLEAAAVVTEADTLDESGQAAVRDLGQEAPIHVAGLDGVLHGTVTGMTDCTERQSARPEDGAEGEGRNGMPKEGSA